jgi:hypothetical protein
MFDLRYHAASLAAVFLALIVGIVVGVGLSRSGFVSGAERKVLNRRIDALQSQLDAARAQQVEASREQQAAEAYVKSTYQTLVTGRLPGTHVALVFVGPVDGQIRSNVQTALLDAGAPPPLRLRALRVPIDDPELDAALPHKPGFAQYRGSDHLSDLGRALGKELVKGGKTPLWDALSDQLLAERTGGGRRPADAVVVARSAGPQQRATARFLDGLYSGLAGAGEPAVGVEISTSQVSAIDVFQRKSLSSVDSVDTLAGKLALVFLLGGGQPGHYGVKESATDGVLPPLYSVPPVTTGG